MACPHYRIASANRARGGSAAGWLAYQERGGHYASRSDDVLATGRSGPDLGDWQVVDDAEDRVNSTVARTLIAAIPCTLSTEAQARVAQAHADQWRAEHGVAVAWALHRAGPHGDARNTHVHFAITTRTVDDQGEIGAKTRHLDRSTTAAACTAALRGHWQNTVNHELQAAGIADRLDLRSRAARGLSEACQRVEQREYEAARRGQTISHNYARNQALLDHRRAQVAHARAVAHHARVHRAAAAGYVARRSARTATRRRGAGRAVDQARRQERVASQRDQANTRNRAPHPGFEPGRPDRQPALAAAEFGGERRGDLLPAVDAGGAAHGDRRGGDRLTPPRPDLGAQQNDGAGLTPRSLIERAARWISGADRREAEAHARAQAQAEQAAALARAQAQAQAQAERDRLIAEARAEAQAQATRAAQAESVRVAAESTEPLVQVQTPTGGRFYTRRDDWLAARAAGARDVPLCDWRGEPIQAQPGERTRTTLRLSTIEASVLRPTAILAATEYLPAPTQEQEGPSLSM